jgi:ABC-type glycerol-3-phosphate transport system substrate-binding protein
MDVKRVDKFLFYAALAVLAAGIVFSVIVGILKPKYTVLTFTQWWQEELEPDTLESLVRNFEDLYPDIKIRLEHQSYEEIEKRILPALFSPEDRKGISYPLPDILGIDQHWMQELIQGEALETLEPYLESPELASFPADVMEQRWALSLVSFISPLFYNIERLQAAGFIRPPKTRSELLAYTRRLTDRSTGRYGFTLALGQDPPAMVRNFFPWIWAAGTALTEEGGKVRFNSPEIIDTLDFLKQLYLQGSLSPDIFAKTEEEKRREFLSGRAGMMLGSISDIEKIRKEKPDFAFGITTVPPPDAHIGKPVLGIDPWYAAITRRCEHKEEAWSFLFFLAQRRSFLAAKAHGVPVKEGGAYAGQDPLYSKAVDIMETGEPMRELTAIPHSGELETVIREELSRMFEGGQSPSAAAQAIQRRWDWQTR